MLSAISARNFMSKGPSSSSNSCWNLNLLISQFAKSSYTVLAIAIVAEYNSRSCCEKMHIAMRTQTTRMRMQCGNLRKYAIASKCMEQCKCNSRQLFFHSFHIDFPYNTTLTPTLICKMIYIILKLDRNVY
jgi:hypothetical protein